MFEQSYATFTQDQIDLGVQPKGIYLVKLTTPQQVFIQKVVKE
ncbi:MAG: T9SS type A sorting domain-containing protein [Flavobacteriales bacterium]|nr:T9SS type A sorting domain-containing protein [Flavobacteriales bacterium]